MYNANSALSILRFQINSLGLQHRPFSTSLALLRRSIKGKITAPVPILKADAYGSVASRLANKSSPTLLYRSNSSLSYILGCYTVGFSLLGAGIFNARTNTMVPNSEIGKGRDIPAYVPTFVYIGSVFMIAGGAYMCLRPQNLVRSITSIPSTTKATSKSLLLEIHRSPSLPFVKPKAIRVPSSDVTLSAPMWMGSEEQVEREIAALTAKEQKANAYDLHKGGLLTLPFRQAVFWLGRGRDGLFKAFTNHGLIQLHVKGHNIPWKVDHRSAWALDEGQALDKLVKIKIA